MAVHMNIPLKYDQYDPLSTGRGTAVVCLFVDRERNCDSLKSDTEDKVKSIVDTHKAKVHMITHVQCLHLSCRDQDLCSIRVPPEACMVSYLSNSAPLHLYK